MDLAPLADEWRITDPGRAARPGANFAYHHGGHPHERALQDGIGRYAPACGLAVLDEAAVLEAGGSR